MDTCGWIEAVFAQLLISMVLADEAVADEVFTPKAIDYLANERTYLAWTRNALTM